MLIQTHSDPKDRSQVFGFGSIPDTTETTLSYSEISKPSSGTQQNKSSPFYFLLIKGAKYVVPAYISVKQSQSGRRFMQNIHFQRRDTRGSAARCRQQIEIDFIMCRRDLIEWFVAQLSTRSIQ